MNGRDKSIAHRAEIEQQLRAQRDAADYLASVPTRVSMVNQIQQKNLSPRDLEKIRAAERKRHRRRNRGW